MADKKSKGTAAAVEGLRAGPPEIAFEEVHFNPKTDRLGGGAFGDVYKATIKGSVVAVKMPKKQQWASAEELQAFKDEVAILKAIFHPNIVLFLGACTQAEHIMICLECMVCDVECVIHKPQSVPALLQKHVQGGLSLFKKLKLMHDTVLGMSWLHDILHMVHRDLKPANLLVDENFRVKITDFGFAEIYKPEKRQTQMKGTALYTAPEVWRAKPYTMAADVYSFGLILWEVYTGEELFPTYEEVNAFYQDVVVKGVRPVIPPSVPGTNSKVPTPENLKKLMNACWNADATLRPTMPQIRVQLENIMMESEIQHEEARAFWKRNFAPSEGMKWLVGWDEMLAALMKETKLEPNQLIPLKKLLCKEENPTIAMDHFDIVAKWFGTFFLPEGHHVVAEITELLEQGWFYPDASREDAERWLAGRPDNVFLVRMSNNSPSDAPFTLSRAKDGGSNHRRMTRITYANEKARYKIETGRKPGFIEGTTCCDIITQLKKQKSVTSVCPPQQVENPYK